MSGQCFITVAPSNPKPMIQGKILSCVTSWVEVEISGIGFTPLFCPYMEFGGLSLSQIDGNRNFARPIRRRCHNPRKLAVIFGHAGPSWF